MYRSRVIAIILDKFGAEKDHKEKGNNLIFDLDKLEQMKKIYENDGKIKIKPVDESFNESEKNERENDKTDSLTHSEPKFRKGGLSESGNNEDNKDPDSQKRLFGVMGINESVNQIERKTADSPKKEKCPYCDYEEHPFFLKVHIKNTHSIGKEPEIRDYKTKEQGLE
jgi:hypothetical protein